MKSSEIISSTKKCEHCGQWTNGELAFCSHCGEILDKKYREERAFLEQDQQEQSPLMKKVRLKKANDSPFWKLVERMLQKGQLILVFLIALVTILLALLPG
jgi:uncharacterized membrane protein YvbJ